jgi:hypothetical protein
LPKTPQYSCRENECNSCLTLSDNGHRGGDREVGHPHLTVTASLGDDEWDREVNSKTMTIGNVNDLSSI